MWRRSYFWSLSSSSPRPGPTPSRPPSLSKISIDKHQYATLRHPSASLCILVTLRDTCIKAAQGCTTVSKGDRTLLIDAYQRLSSLVATKYSTYTNSIYQHDDESALPAKSRISLSSKYVQNFMSNLREVDEFMERNMLCVVCM